MNDDERKTDSLLAASPEPETLEALLQAHLPSSLPALPHSPEQLLSLARDRLPALRAELEFWQMVVARAGQSLAAADARFPVQRGASGARLK